MAREAETGQPATWEQGDSNGDGIFTFQDLLIALATGTYEMDLSP